MAAIRISSPATLALLLLSSCRAHGASGVRDQDDRLSFDSTNGTDTALFRGFDVEHDFWNQSNPREKGATWQANLAVRANIPKSEVDGHSDNDGDEDEDEPTYMGSQISVSLRDPVKDIEDRDDSWAMCLTLGWVVRTRLDRGQGVHANCTNALPSDCLRWLRDSNSRGSHCRNGAADFEGRLADSPCSNTNFPYEGDEKITWTTFTNLTYMDQGIQWLDGPYSDDEDADDDDVEGNKTAGYDEAMGRVWVLLLDWGQDNGTMEGDIDSDSMNLDGAVRCVSANNALNREDDDDDDDDDGAAAMLGAGRLGQFAVLVAAVSVGVTSFIM